MYVNTSNQHLRNYALIISYGMNKMKYKILRKIWKESTESEYFKYLDNKEKDI
jgi:hypothetical protein